MRPRGWLLVVAGLLATFLPWAQVSAFTNHPLTLTLSIPGPITGCYYYGAQANATLRAVLDLVRPSAFNTDTNGNLTGAAGPVVQSELVSLAPQTVVYSLNTRMQWSNGLPFNGVDFQSWYLRARVQPTALADGYRAISSLTVNSALDRVTVVFARPFSDWPMLFRDMNQRATRARCVLSSLDEQASLGPYVLQRITSTEAVLIRNALWTGSTPYFDVVHIRTDLAPEVFPSRQFVDYRYQMSTPDLVKTTANVRLDGHIGSSDHLVVVGFSPHRRTTVQLIVRQFLGWSIDRQRLINQLVGPLSYNQGLADSVLYSQGQRAYPGNPGVPPVAQSLVTPLQTIPTSLGQDCVACAPTILPPAEFTFTRHRWHWHSGRLLRVVVAVGPTAMDRQVALAIAHQWRAVGLWVVLKPQNSDTSVARTLSHGRVDVGIFTVSLSSETSTTARSWTQKDFGDGFDLGWRSALVDQWYASALNTFNPNDAVASWLAIDHQISTQAWERPLFSEPSVVTWSQDVSGIYGSTSIIGFVDQVPTWGLAPTNSP